MDATAMRIETRNPPVRSPETSRLELEIHDSFSSIEAEWRDFEERAVMSCYQGFRWLELWHEHIGRHNIDRLLLVTGRRNGRTVFLWPMGVWRSGPLRIARWLGGKYNNYNVALWTAEEFAAMDAASLEAALAEVAEMGGIDVFELMNQPQNWDCGNPPFAALGGQPSPSNSHRMELEPDFKALYTRRRSGRSRRGLRRKREIMAQAGAIRLLHARDEATALRIVEASVEQRNARAVDAGIPNVFADTGSIALVRDIILDGLSAKSGPVMQAHALEVDGIIRATYVGGKLAGRYSCFVNSFRPDELAPSSPGEQLLHDVVEQCCKDGMTTLDLGIGEERYKTSWCNPDPLLDLYIPVTAFGHLYARSLEFKQTVKRAIKSNPVLWRMVKTARRWRGRAGV